MGTPTKRGLGAARLWVPLQALAARAGLTLETLMTMQAADVARRILP